MIHCQCETEPPTFSTDLHTGFFVGFLCAIDCCVRYRRRIGKGTVCPDDIGASQRAPAARTGRWISLHAWLVASDSSLVRPHCTESVLWQKISDCYLHASCITLTTSPQSIANNLTEILSVHHFRLNNQKQVFCMRHTCHSWNRLVAACRPAKMGVMSDRSWLMLKGFLVCFT